MIEKTLFITFESRAGGGLGIAVVGAAVLAGDIGGFQRLIEISVNDLEGIGIGVVDANLLGCQLMLDDFVFDAFKRQGTGGIEAERLEIARQYFHGGDPALFHRRNKIGTGGKRKITGAPQAEPHGIGQVLNRGGAGRRYIEDACIVQCVLQAQSRLALLRGFLVATLAFVAGGIGHGVRFVKDDDAIKTAAKPVDDLLDTANLVALGLGAKSGVGG